MLAAVERSARPATVRAEIRATPSERLGMDDSEALAWRHDRTKAGLATLDGVAADRPLRSELR